MSNDEPKKSEDDGMTLRDYFAAKALQALLHDVASELSQAKFETQIKTPKALALLAYTFADAMLEERDNPPINRKEQEKE
jgi:hypothetical protein